MDRPVLSSPSNQYRPDIDGLRAIAVMLVLHFHAFPEAIPGGYIGVDVFFVISGFLITGIIARELDQKRFSLLGFYDRRIRRIFPALTVVLGDGAGARLVLDVTGGLCSTRQSMFSPVRRSLPTSRCCCSPAISTSKSAKKPLLHLWSLGIEEQFYLLWPLILMLAVRLRLSILAVTFTLGIASFVLNLALIGVKPGRDILSAFHPRV